MKLTILNANLWLLPPPSSVDNTNRLNKFIALAKKLDPDIINLQEVWLNEYIKKLKKSFKNYYLVSPRSIIYNKSGLVTISKYKPKKWKYHQYKITREFGLVERLANKGYLKLEIKINNKLLNLFNTHIYESPHPNKQFIKETQAKSLKKEILKNNISIATGDLNLKLSSFKKIFPNIITEQNPLNTYLEENKYTKMIFNQLKNRTGIYNRKPDYILVNSKSKKISIQTKVIKKPLISDHYPFIAEVDF